MGRLLKTISIYFVGNFVNRLMGFVVMSVATYALTNQSDFGYFSSSQNMINLIMTLVCLQAWTAIIRFVFDYDKKSDKIKVITTGYFIEFITFIIYSLGYIIFNLICPVRDSIELYLLSFGYIFNQGVQFACRGLGKNKLYVISGIVGSASQLISSILFLFVFHMTSNALILAMAISYFAQALFIELFLKSTRYFKPKYINLKLSKKMLKYCIPNALNFAASWISDSSHLNIITICISQAATGIFSAAFKMNSLITFVMIAFNLAFQEYSFSINKNNVREKMYNKVFVAFIKFMSCGIMMLIPITSILFSIIIGPSYESAKELVPLLYIGCFLNSLQAFLGSILQAEKKVNLLFISQLIGSVITICVMLATINFVGLHSAAISMIACFLIVSLIRIYGLRTNIVLKFNITYFLHFSLMFILTVYIYINCSELINLLYCPVVGVYFLFCIKHLLKNVKQTISRRIR